MTNEEIEKAIKKGRLPLSTIDKIVLVAGFCSTLYIIYMSVQIYFRWGLPTSIWAIFSGGSIITIVVWKLFWLKKLTPYLSDSAIAKKGRALKRLGEEPTAHNFKIEEQYCSLYFKKKEWYNTAYDAIILYDDTGYFIKVSTGSGNSKWLASGKTQQIIGKLKQHESEL